MRHKGLGYAQGHLTFKLQGVFPLLSPSQVCPVPTFSLDTSCIRAISIDLDDTLWPIWPTIAKGEQVLLNWLTLHVDADRKLTSGGCGRKPGLVRRQAPAIGDAPWG